jgi:hypothetical protein
VQVWSGKRRIIHCLRPPLAYLRVRLIFDFPIHFRYRSYSVNQEEFVQPRSDNEIHKQWLAATANMLCAFVHFPRLLASLGLVKIRMSSNRL